MFNQGLSLKSILIVVVNPNSTRAGSLLAPATFIQIGRSDQISNFKALFKIDETNQIG